MRSASFRSSIAARRNGRAWCSGSTTAEPAAALLSRDQARPAGTLAYLRAREQVTSVYRECTRPIWLHSSRSSGASGLLRGRSRPPAVCRTAHPRPAAPSGAAGPRPVRRQPRLRRCDRRGVGASRLPGERAASARATPSRCARGERACALALASKGTSGVIRGGRSITGGTIAQGPNGSLARPKAGQGRTTPHRTEAAAVFIPAFLSSSSPSATRRAVAASTSRCRRS